MDNRTTKPITPITISDYNLESARLQIVRQCIADNPEKGWSEIAQILGITLRTLYRLKQKHGLRKPYAYQARMIKTLRAQGFEVNAPRKQSRKKH